MILRVRLGRIPDFVHVIRSAAHFREGNGGHNIRSVTLSGTKLAGVTNTQTPISAAGTWAPVHIYLSFTLSGGHIKGFHCTIDLLRWLRLDAA